GWLAVPAVLRAAPGTAARGRGASVRLRMLQDGRARALRPRLAEARGQAGRSDGIPAFRGAWLAAGRLPRLERVARGPRLQRHEISAPVRIADPLPARRGPARSPVSVAVRVVGRAARG